MASLNFYTLLFPKSCLVLSQDLNLKWSQKAFFFSFWDCLAVCLPTFKVYYQHIRPNALICKALLHCAFFSATCLAMVEKVALQAAEVWCWGPVTLCNFLSNLSRNAPRNEKQEVCACALVKTAVTLRDKLLEGWYTVQWCCQLLQSVAKSRAEFYFVQRFAQQKDCETTHVTMCNSPATYLATALRDKLLRKLHSVTGP